MRAKWSSPGSGSRFRSPAEARRAGIVSVYQDPAIVPDLTVAQNMRLARVSLDAVKAAMRELGDRADRSLGPWRATSISPFSG